jgi:hypothetical protein
MSVSVAFSGSITPTLNVQHIFGTINAAGVYYLEVDCSNMTFGDDIEIRVTSKVPAGTVGALYFNAYSHQQATQLKGSPPLITEGSSGMMLTIRQTAGSTMKNFPFKVLSI